MTSRIEKTLAGLACGFALAFGTASAQGPVRPSTECSVDGQIERVETHNGARIFECYAGRWSLIYICTGTGSNEQCDAA